MLDMGFIHDIRRVIAMLPEKRQSLFFSATMPDSIVKLSKTILTDPVRVEVARVNSAAETVDQRMLFVSQGAKRDLLVEILNRPEVETALVFTRTKYGADKVVRYLRKNNIRGEAIHGNKSQPQREKAMNAFRKGKSMCWWPPTSLPGALMWKASVTSSTLKSPTSAKLRAPHWPHRARRARRRGHFHGERRRRAQPHEGHRAPHQRHPLDTDQWHLNLPEIKADSKTHKPPKDNDDSAQGNRNQRPSRKGRGGHRRRGAQGQKNQRQDSSQKPNNPNREGRTQGEGNHQGRPSGNRRWKKKPKFRGPKPQGDRS